MVWLSLLLLFSLQEKDAPADEMSEIQSRMEKIETHLTGLRGKLSALDNDSRKISDEVNRLELERALLTADMQKHELQLQESTLRLAETEEHQAALTEKAEQQRQRLAHRLRGLYKRGTLGYSRLLLKQNKLSELINAYHYAKIMTRRDQESLSTFLATVEALEVVETQLLDIQARAEETRNQLAQKRKEMDTLLVRRNRRLRTIRGKARENRELYGELELEKEELSLMIRRLTETDLDPMTLQIPIEKYRGRLDWPCSGKLLRGFGVYEDPEFKTKRKQNGIAITVPVGEPVASVYSGRVIYADWFKNYGNLVILDHGDKTVTFYAHNERLLVAKGDYVTRGQTIAFSGDTGSLDGPLLHFEIRRQTQPEDPLDWLVARKRSGRRK